MKFLSLLLIVVALLAFSVTNLQAEEAAEPGQDNENSRPGLSNRNAPPGGKTRVCRARENGAVKEYTFTEEENGKIRVKETTFGRGGGSVKEYEFESVEAMKEKDEKLYGYYTKAAEVRRPGFDPDRGQRQWGRYLKNMPLNYILRYLEHGMLKGDDVDEALKLVPEKLIDLLKQVDTVLKKYADCSLEDRLALDSMTWLPECVFKGVKVKPVGDVIKAQMKLKGGVVIMDLPDDSEFAKAGLEKYDIIVGIDNKKVEDIESLNTAFTEAPKDKKAEIKIIREGKEKKITMKIPEVPAPDQPDENGENEEKDADEEDKEDVNSAN